MKEIKRAKRLSHAVVHLVIARASLFTDQKKYQVYQYGSNTSNSEQSVSKLLTILEQIPFLLPWIGGHPCMVLRLCIFVELFCVPSRNILPRASLHDLPCHRTMKKCSRQVSLNKVAFPKHQRRFWIQTRSCNCPQYLCLFDFLFECNPNKRGQGIMSVLPNQRLS